MHVLFLAKAYNDKYDKGSGVFVREQALAIASQNVTTGVIAVNFTSWKKCFTSFSLRTKISKDTSNGIQSLVYQTPVIPFFKAINHWRRDKLLKKLSEKYFDLFGTPDVCHVHGFYCGNEAIRLKKQHNIPYIITEHYSVFARQMTSKSERKRAKAAYEQSFERIAVSPDFCNLLKKTFQLDFQYIPNIVHVEKFPLKTNNKETGFFNFLIVGTLNSNKNHQLALEAIPLIKEKNCRLTIIGTGPLMNKLKKTAAKLTITDTVDFVGYVDNQLLFHYFHQNHALLVTSKYETFGITMIEAMCCGLPVISTPVGVAHSLITDKKFGYICKPNPHDLAQAMQHIMSSKFDPHIIRTMITETFSAEIIAMKLITLYEKTFKQ